MQTPPSAFQEPARGQALDLLERAGFLEEMGRAGDDGELRSVHLSLRGLIQVYHGRVGAADDQERGGTHGGERVARQIAAPAAADDRSNDLGAVCCGDQGGGGAGARAEVADGQVSQRLVLAELVGGLTETARQERNVEAKALDDGIVVDEA